jgi:hypothetical protein
VVLILAKQERVENLACLLQASVRDAEREFDLAIAREQHLRWRQRTMAVVAAVVNLLQSLKHWLSYLFDDTFRQVPDILKEVLPLGNVELPTRIRRSCVP